MDAKDIAKELGVDPEKIDFTIADKELDHISGGVGNSCLEMGYSSQQSTNSGVGTSCTEIGCISPDCTKVGM